MEYSKKAVGRRIKSGIVDLGITNEQFAELVGVSKHTVDEWCLGRVGLSFENAIKVADVLGWPLDRVAVREKTV